MKVTGTRDVKAIRTEARRAIDDAAERLRSHPALLTPGSGMALTYASKEGEAREYLADPDGYTPGDYPLLEASIGIEGDDIHQVAQVVANIAAQWRQIAAMIENIRLGSKKAVDEAGTPAAIIAAQAQGLAGLDQIRALLDE